MKTFTRNEIINKHGKFIPYFSKSNGSTELEKFKNSFVYNSTDSIYEVTNSKGVKLTCVARFNGSSHQEDNGYFMMVFNDQGELIEDTFPGCMLHDNSLESIEQLLTDFDLY